ncbi:hypothetical protein [Lysobacter humi (ex Lee et al. 2017)]
MARARVLAAVVLVAALPALHAQGAKDAKKLYCWNEGGRKVCGDALPADAVDAERTEYGTSGMANARVGRALSPAERAAAEAQAKAEQTAAEQAAAEHRRLMAMVESFATEADLRRAFTNRIDLNRDSVKTAEMGIAGIRQTLVGLLRRAGEAELAKKPVPKKLADDIRSQHAQLVTQQGQLVRLQQESGLIQAQLDEAVMRYREIKTAASGSTTATPAAATATAG